ncbi:glycosyltransferase [Stenotrophobium rhamnosiphilum]|uniref:Glycosyltransferase family 4 protein n=1 Tax=Stenotrophobium rhamnosiphilum TaxID=2029166 RepID=A0A2T5MK15_9GAMM|nr:glycosyltransferase [Stenotrophobium rhamnosiphilum]PTU32926.1 glycosyltransferase family 4 protein [Stenotrophobium rhamnosiphilum]
MEINKKMKVALVADWITDRGGAELVFEHLLRLFPDADVFTSVVKGDHPMLRGHRVTQSWLAKLPFLANRHKWSAVFRPYAFRGFNLSAYDLVISSASAEAKHVVIRPGAAHICYCHTPTRYYWSHAEDYMARPGFGWMDYVVSLGLRFLLPKMRALDLEAAKRVTAFVANSATTAERILQYYARESVIVHPGIPLDRFQVGTGSRGGYLAVGRIVPYKRFDLLVEAFNHSGRRLTIVSSIQNELSDKLVSLSNSNIQWHFALPDAEKLDLMQKSRAVMFPQEEDFGIVPIEAMACGTPLVAYRSGGATETVVENVSGIFFDEQTAESLNAAIGEFEKREWSPTLIRDVAEGFSTESFGKKIRSVVSAVTAESQLPRNAA